jgi:cbb3-type cytochrome oxidase subunit 3
MSSQGIAYFLFGLTLVVLFGVIIVHYYSKKHRNKVEKAKFTMLDDDD